ncbi:MAG TPA: efflux RND transporter periplasmic adaptor subunit [Alphaproteobacteria bacterium]|nr:efflux RND transporter periplasmic adaptor subunit [Alphaproteobacteria bacterium]
MMRTILTLILLAVIGYGGWYAYQHFIVGGAGGAGGGGMAGFAMPVEGTTVQPEALAIVLNATGTISADAEAILKAEIAGRVEKILFEEGGKVSSGAPLIEIDARSARANFEQAQASASLARQNMQRMQPLAGSGAIAATELDQFAGNEKIAIANERAAAVALDKATVKAPFSGRIGIRRVNLGDYVQPGQELVMVTRADDVRIEFTVPEQQAAMVSAGQAISFTSEIAPGEKFEGTIVATEPSIDMNGRQMRVLARADNADGKLRPGGFVNISATVAEKSDTLLVPEGALVPMGDQQLIMVVGADGAVQPRPVKLGLRQAGRVEVTEGLSAGETVVTAGQMKLAPGAKVQILPPPGAQPAAAEPAAATTDTPAAIAPEATEPTAAVPTEMEAEPVIPEALTPTDETAAPASEDSGETTP